MHPAERLLAAFLLLWWLLSLAFQLHATLRRRLAALYELGFLSGYRFFATPRNLDTQIQTRTRDVSGQPTPWLPTPPPVPRTCLTTFWNPAARTESAYRFTASMLLSTLQHRGRAAACRSPVHRRLLASLQQKSQPIQFRILHGNAFLPGHPPSPVFQSDWHTGAQ